MLEQKFSQTVKFLKKCKTASKRASITEISSKIVRLLRISFIYLITWQPHFSHSLRYFFFMHENVDRHLEIQDRRLNESPDKNFCFFFLNQAKVSRLKVHNIHGLFMSEYVLKCFFNDTIHIKMVCLWCLYREKVSFYSVIDELIMMMMYFLREFKWSNFTKI